MCAKLLLTILFNTNEVLDPAFTISLVHVFRDSASYVSGCSDRIRMENHRLAFCPLPLETPHSQKNKNENPISAKKNNFLILP